MTNVTPASIDIATLPHAAEAPADPLTLFTGWLDQAAQSEPSDPNAMCLATIGADGRPHARIVLLKAHDLRGFVFFTNMNSRKGDDLKAHDGAALNFHWKTLQRCVRIEGRTETIADSESDTYFATRARGSQIGAWASRQSRPLDSRAAIEERIAYYQDKFRDTDPIPRPPYWYGTRVIPERIEFWHEGAHRLHTRLLYTRTAPEKDWDRTLLYP